MTVDTDEEKSSHSVASYEMKFTATHGGLQAHRFGSYNTMHLIIQFTSVCSYQPPHSHTWVISPGFIYTELYNSYLDTAYFKIPKCASWKTKKKIWKKPPIADSNKCFFNNKSIIHCFWSSAGFIREWQNPNLVWISLYRWIQQIPSAGTQHWFKEFQAQKQQIDSPPVDHNQMAGNSMLLNFVLQLIPGIFFNPNGLISSAYCREVTKKEKKNNLFEELHN